ncbi:hypothetical protein [Azotobacter beijerinckii]|uniref:Uncharacterized protein n=1 Tax=Azotobacter beijerinckii TaxID=170623 RepID=A0A1I3ZNQ7_9GAMM|nr:hypothetical protein [Azotobacter beijerinckii]SFK45570.1 hypothetical protein SAMN04244574_00679 [Azotobacter beijerinckii]
MGYFEEKAEQVSPAVVVAFGIELCSRYGKAAELREMLAFAEAVAIERAERYVSKVFYDSAANLCTFELADGVQRFDPVGCVLWEAADSTIEQFELFEVIGGLHSVTPELG